MRLRFLDTARCVAMVMMVLAHVRDGLLAPEHGAHWLMRLHDGTRGLTAPLFFLVSGWAFSAATLPRRDEFTRWGAPLRARLERVALLFLTGKLLTLPWWHEAFPLAVPRETWLPFTTSGVLECIAVAMLASYALLWLAPSARQFTAWSLAASAGAALAAPLVHELTAGWPLWPGGVFHAAGVAGAFPVAPFGAYFWLGAALGALRAPPARAAAVCAGLAALFLLSRPALAPLVPVLAPGARAAVSSLGLVLWRAGIALAMLAALGCVHLQARVSLQRLGRRAFTFYVAHMALLWGVPFVPGLVHRVGQTLGVEGVLSVTLVMLAGTAGLCLVTERRSTQQELIHVAQS